MQGRQGPAADHGRGAFDYVDFTIDLVNGNRSSVTRLAGRYPGALQRIQRVSVLARSR